MSGLSNEREPRKQASHDNASIRASVPRARLQGQLRDGETLRESEMGRAEAYQRELPAVSAPARTRADGFRGREILRRSGSVAART